MAKPDKPKERRGDDFVTTRVTVAFPFSQIRTEEASDELRELAKIVGQLAEQVAKIEPTPELEALVEQARNVVTRLQ